MAKYLISLPFIIFFSAALFSQNSQSQTQKPPAPEQKASAQKSGEKNTKEDPFPPQAVTTDLITIGMPTFNKKVDLKGRGEILDAAFSITDNRDGKNDLYVFVIASYEDIEWRTNSFGTKKTFPEKIRIVEFVPNPGKKENFEYDINGVKELKKYAKDFKLGVDPFTGKSYIVKDSINIRTEHLTLYRKNYKFFNTATILIYDDEGKVLFRQIYNLSGNRTR